VVALAEVEAELDLVQEAQAADLRLHMDEVDVERALQIEAEIHHDKMAELKVFAEQAPCGGAILHLEHFTDIEDNATPCACANRLVNPPAAANFAAAFRRPGGALGGYPFDRLYPPAASRALYAGYRLAQ